MMWGALGFVSCVPNHAGISRGSGGGTMPRLINVNAFFSNVIALFINDVRIGERKSRYTTAVLWLLFSFVIKRGI